MDADFGFAEIYLTVPEHKKYRQKDGEVRLDDIRHIIDAANSGGA